MINRIVREIVKYRTGPDAEFKSERYLRHNQRRLEHLASLGLDLHGSAVLEVGAGVGDHTGFFIDRQCRVTSTDARTGNLDVLRSRFPDARVIHLDLDSPVPEFTERFDIVYCYGLLYHLHNPSGALEFMSRYCRRLLLLETCVSYGGEESLHPVVENRHVPSQAVSGYGCRPTRVWVFNQLRNHFEHVYLPITQPDHEEFPLEWSVPASKPSVSRAVFIASRNKLDNQRFVEGLPMRQERYQRGNSD